LPSICLCCIGRGSQFGELKRGTREIYWRARAYEEEEKSANNFPLERERARNFLNFLDVFAVEMKNSEELVKNVKEQGRQRD
jgi:hypothetical protein